MFELPGVYSATLALAVALAVGGCKEDTEPAAPVASQEPIAARPDIDLLRSLPYVGYVEGSQQDTTSGVILHDQLRSCPGYSLYTVQMLSMAELIDPAGTVIRRWRQPGSDRWERAELLPNGDLLVVGVDPFENPNAGIPDSARYLMRQGWNGEVIWKRKMIAHHDVELTPRGQLLAMTFQRRRIAGVNPDIDAREDQLSLLDLEGNVLSVRSLLDVIKTNPDAFRLHQIKPVRFGGAVWIDPLHSNSVEWMHFEKLAGTHPIYATSHVLICSRHQDRIAVFNWDNGQLIWSWGLGILSGPHDAHWLENGHILVFDNGLARGWSRVIELDPVTEKILWEYRAPVPGDFYSLTKGSSQRLPNGNTLITNSDKGQAFEVTPEGEVVWIFLCPHTDRKGRRAALVRTMRYDKDLVDSLVARAIRAGKKQTP